MAAAGGREWSPRQESNLYPTLRRHVHYPLCYGEDVAARPMLGHMPFGMTEPAGAVLPFAGRGKMVKTLAIIAETFTRYGANCQSIGTMSAPFI